VGELERARGLCELAISQEKLDMPELVWKRYIDLEVSHDEMEMARKVWLKLVSKSNHVRVYIAYSEFEALQAQAMPMARESLEQGIKSFKGENRCDERAMLLEHWLKLEREYGCPKTAEDLERRQAKRVKKRRSVRGEDGQDAVEEYMDYVFPDDAPAQQNP